MVIRLEEFLPSPPLALTREEGRRCYPVLCDQVAAANCAEVEIEIGETIIMDYSFADEALGQLFSDLIEGRFGDRYVAVRVSNADQYDNLAASIRLRKLVARVFLAGRSSLISHDQNRQELNDTLGMLATRSSVTASELAKETGLALTTWNNRLARAHQLHLIRREEAILPAGGRQYVYTSVFDPDRAKL